MLGQDLNIQLFVRFILMVSVSLGILWLSLTPSPPTFDTAILGWDKAQHALAYGVLTLTSGLFFRQYGFPAKQAWWGAVIYAIVFGGVLELLQAIAGTGRSCEWTDLVADTVGALTVGIIGLYKQKGHKG